MNNYLRFSVMLSVSFVIMYGVMYLNVSEANHIYLSLSRLYMTILMVSPMALLMMGMMWGMYPNKKLNAGIMVVSVVVFATTLFLLRTQTFVADEQYMKAMISHHSSAILTSEHAGITDPELKKLAEEIIVAQEREIKQMKGILKRMD